MLLTALTNYWAAVPDLPRDLPRILLATLLATLLPVDLLLDFEETPPDEGLLSYLFWALTCSSLLRGFTFEAAALTLLLVERAPAD